MVNPITRMVSMEIVWKLYGEWYSLWRFYDIKLEIASPLDMSLKQPHWRDS